MECTNIVSNRRAGNGSYENSYQKLKNFEFKYDD